MVTKNTLQETSVKITKWVLEELRKYRTSNKQMQTKFKSDKDIIDNIIMDYLVKKGVLKNEKK